MSTDSLSTRVGRTLRGGPKQTLLVARREVGRAVKPRARRAWTGVALRMARLTSSRSIAETTFLGVLDGHTLNLQATLPDLEGAVPVAAELLFSHESSTQRTPVTLREADGRWLVEATVLLGDRAGATRLNRGVWQLGLLVTLDSGETRRLTVRRMTAATAARRAPTVAVPPCPDTGTRYRPSTTAAGAWQITVRPGRPRAEVARLVVDLGGTEIIGRFVGVAERSGAYAEFTRRGDELTHEVPVAVTGDIFRIHAPLARMSPAGGTKEIWDVRVRIPGGPGLRVGRWLHDLTNLARVLRPYERRILMPDGVAFHLRPYYTPAGSLALACTSAEPGAAA
jgi:hypothetical protein